MKWLFHDPDNTDNESLTSHSFLVNRVAFEVAFEFFQNFCESTSKEFYFRLAPAYMRERIKIENQLILRLQTGNN